MGTDTNGLVTINGTKGAATEGGGGLSRRSFLKVLGSASAVGAVGCADKATQQVLPYVKPENEQIPGVAMWYRSTCTECDAGCGIQVRTREGRAVKIEGSPDHPVNKGGLCALGQAAIQGLYDPDRVRQPLQRSVDAAGKVTFKPIGWSEAYAKIAGALKATNHRGAFVTGEMTGALEDLTGEWAKAFNVDHVVWDPAEQVAVARAAEVVYGTFGIPSYAFDKAEVVLNFGADFLETWISPCEYARGWADARRAEKRLRVVHVEPRLSLTGANADMWLNAKPGSEIRIALAILGILLDSGKGENLSGEVRSRMAKLVEGVSAADAARESGVELSRILLAAEYLRNAGSSLVIAGGTAAASADPLPLQVVCGFLNLVLGNVGRTVNIAAMRSPRTSAAKLAALVQELKDGKVNTLFVYNTNPNFTFPVGFGFRYAARNANLVVSFSSHLDETAELADLILPSSHNLESWGDQRKVPGMFSLSQPVMAPVFDTKMLGDMLLELAGAGGQGAVARGAKSFEEYLKASWQKVHASAGSGKDFNRFWIESVERGGWFNPGAGAERARVDVSADAWRIATAAQVPAMAQDELVLFPYISVKSFDGRAANRPWLQELPDPITKIVWDAWAEIHPDTAKRFSVAQGDMLTVRNEFGEVNLAVYVTSHVHPDIVAIPIGQGHTSYGRFASQVGGGNVLDLVVPKVAAGADALPLMGAPVKVRRGRGQAKTVILQGSDSQGKRELARNTLAAAVAAGAGGHGAAHAVDHGNGLGAGAHGGAAHGGGGGGGHGGHHEPKQMYVQREHPVYSWGLAIDLDACTGCSACVVACYAENNIAIVGKEQCWKGREMSWLRIERYYGDEAGELQVNFLPMMCQHCGNAPCEPVCPVYATYHNDEGLNAMVYNRCVGTRYCSNNCSYKVRRFNWYEYEWPEPLTWGLNPDVTKRTTGIMEKCTFCVQRINEAKDQAKDAGRLVQDGDVQPACVQSCPTQALVFGNLNDPKSRVSRMSKDGRAYKVLDHHINTQPAVSYLERVRLEQA